MSAHGILVLQNADLTKGPAATLMEKYGRRFFAAQEQCNFPYLLQRMLTPSTFDPHFDPQSLWGCLMRPLRTSTPAPAEHGAAGAAPRL